MKNRKTLKPGTSKTTLRHKKVDYRGEFKPELSQLLSQAQMMDGAEFADDEMGEMSPLSQEQLEQMMKNSAGGRHPRRARRRRDVV